MAHVIDLPDGSFLIPANIFDALEAVEEYMGADMRQYLEGYFIDGEDEFLAEKDERISTLLEGLECLAENMGIHLGKRTMNRKELLDDVEGLKRAIEREMKRTEE